MKTYNRLFMLLLTCICSSGLLAQDQKVSAGDKAWMDNMSPGKMHEMLAKSAGMWNEDVTMWMTADATPMKSTMNCMNKMIMGNRYLQGMNRGSFNGMQFEGISTVGYDNAKKVYVSTWIDNMGTGIMYTEGRYDEVKKSIEFNGTQIDPMSGKEMKVREVFKFIDDNNQFMEMYMTPNAGKEYKSMEIKYTRKVNPAQNNGEMKPTPVPPAPSTDKK